MSDHSHNTSPAPERLTHDVKTVGNIALIVGIVALAISFLGGLSEAGRVQLSHSYLFAFMYFFTIAAGAFFWIILHHACNANWTVLVRRQFENIATIFVPLLVLFIPLYIFRQDLWDWTKIGWTHQGLLEHADTALLKKQPYLSMTFFMIRTVFYFAFFIGATYFFRNSSVQQDDDGSIVHSWRMRWWAPLSIIGFGLGITFSAVDWLMALDYHWVSTMWGVYIFAGAAQSSMATLIIVLWILRSYGYLKPLTSEHTHIIGKLLFAFVVFWAYIAFSQYMLIWYANIPEEHIFFDLRNVGSWSNVSVLLVAGHFVIPFVYLLTQAVKKGFASLGIIAIWILFMHAVDHFWIVIPLVRPAGFQFHWLDFTCWIGIAGIAVWWFTRSLSNAGLFPSRDPRLAECINLTN